MGVTGVIPNCRPAMKEKNICNFKNSTIAIDAVPWIIYGTYHIMGQQSRIGASIQYFSRRIKKFLSLNIRPIFVFDGKRLPAKSGEHAKREAMKKNNPQMLTTIQKQEVQTWILKFLQSINIDFIVAPYEADAQLAWMALNDEVDYVESIDSDLILYGCPKIIYKLRPSGECKCKCCYPDSEIRYEMLIFYGIL